MLPLTAIHLRDPHGSLPRCPQHPAQGATNSPHFSIHQSLLCPWVGSNRGSNSSFYSMQSKNKNRTGKQAIQVVGQTCLSENFLPATVGRMTKQEGGRRAGRQGAIRKK